MKTGYVIIFLLFTRYSFCQLNETFSDGDFKNNPVWQGDTSFFRINNSFELQSRGPAASSNIKLSTENQYLVAAQWEFLVGMQFQPSTTNFCKIYLASNQSDLKGSLQGYFLKIGGEAGTTDKIELFRQNGTSSIKIMTGVPGKIGKAINKVRIKVLRDIEGNWSVFSDTSGGYNYDLEGKVFDNTYVNTSWFGLVCIHSSTRKDHFFFDDLIIRPIPLYPIQAIAVSPKSFRLSFSKEVNKSSAENTSFYNLTNAGSPIQALKTTTNSVDLIFSNPISKGIKSLEIHSVEDLEGNQIANQIFNFFFDPPLSYGSVLITEIYPDPTPSNGLPEEEFVEIFNNTNDTINLGGMTYGDPSTSITLPNKILLPGAFLTLCPSSALTNYQSYGEAISVSPWPSLNNSGDHLTIKDPKGTILFEVKYSSSWFKSPEKKEGGWSLEMINYSDYCSETNWKESISEIGGTPSGINSVFSNEKDLKGPLIEFLDYENNFLIIEWNEELDTTIVPTTKCGEYILTNSFFGNTKILIELNQSLVPGTNLTIENVYDCKGNIANTFSTPLYFPQKGETGDLIINEILFNPRPGGVDFVELFNKSDKVIDLKNWKIGSLKTSDTLKANLSKNSLLIHPYSYLAFCPSVKILENNYYLEPERVKEITGFPSYNDDKGTVFIYDPENSIVDRFDYFESYHLRILDDIEGISLERISAWGPSNSPDNWHSASSTAGYATPGRENSQSSKSQNNEPFRAEPKVFSPNQDGRRDFSLIHYSFNEPGFIVTLSVFDLAGRKISTLGENKLVGISGFFEWDGISDNGAIASPGLYILLMEAFNSNGEKITWKGTVIISP